MFSVALSVPQAYGPSPEHPPAALAVSQHIALRSSDFPLPRPCLPRDAGRSDEAAITRLART